jgi:hypothetical protein
MFAMSLNNGKLNACKCGHTAFAEGYGIPFHLPMYFSSLHG